MRRREARESPACPGRGGFIHSSHHTGTNTQTFKNKTFTVSHLAHITPVSFLMLATCDVYRAHRHGSESSHPGSTPGLNPCNYLAWLWRVDRGGHTDTAHT